MTKFAAKTDVTVARTREEIERTLLRYGAGSFIFGWHQDGRALVAFTMEGRQIRFLLPLPNREDAAFCRTDAGQPRTEGETDKRYAQALRSRWRALLLIIKAKLEAIESGICTFEDEFLANTVLPNGQLAGEWARPQVDEAYRIGAMPPMVPMLPAPAR